MSIISTSLPSCATRGLLWFNADVFKPDEIQPIADFLDCTVDELLGKKEGPLTNGGGPLRTALPDSFGQLNQEGQERLVETADNMVRSGKYKKSGAADLGRQRCP